MSHSSTRQATADTVREDLKRRLRAGEFSPGDKLPSLRQLAQAYNARVSAVHHAVLGLRHEGLVETQHGSGVYVSQQRTALRQVLLLHPSEGDEWADYSRAIAATFSSDPNTRLLVESVTMGAGNDPQRTGIVREKVQAMIGEGLDVILFNGMPHFQLKWLRDFASQVQMVCFYDDRAVDDLPCARVLTDWYHGGYVAMRHLIEVGCRDILLTQHHETMRHPTNLLRAGAEAAAAESTHEINLTTFTASVSEPADIVQQRIATRLTQDDRPDGVLAHADWLAARFVSTMHRLKIRVPEDMAVAGYFDTPWVLLTDPPLTSISTQPEKVAQAIRQLCDAGDFNTHIAIKPRLVARGSTVPGASA